MGAMRKVEVDGKAICVAHAEDDQFYAIDDTCSHEEESLSTGELWECEVECPRHSSTFDLRTGRPSGTPATLPVATYPVEVADGQIYVVV